MKKTIILASVAIATLFAFSSCQKEELEKTSVSGVRVITAEFENNGTKTTLNDGKTPEWAEGDVIRILNSSSHEDITLAAGNITNNKITFTTSLEGTLYAVYPASATAMTSCSGSITYTIPAIQDGTFASANICVAKSSTEDGTNKENLVFRNATAVLKIKTAADVVGVDVTAANSIAGPVTASFEGTTLSLTTSSLDKKSVSAVGTSAPSGNVFYLATAPVTTGSATVNCYKTDKKGTVAKDSKALAKNTIYSMDLSSMTINTACDLTGTKGTLNGHEYVIIKAKYDGSNDSYLKWATMNVGATTETEYGWFFSWGNTTGYVYDSTNKKWVKASDNTTQLGSDGSFSDSNYKNETVSGKGTNLTGSIPVNAEYDAALANWGEGWRMPTGGDEGEFNALIEATYWKWDATDKGCYVYVPQTGDAGKKNGETTNTYNKSDALLFFPAAGGSSQASRSDVGSSGRYWSSTLHSSSTYAFRLNFTSDSVNPKSGYDRYYGYLVRPVSD